jgi:hypothetical protein
LFLIAHGGWPHLLRRRVDEFEEDRERAVGAGVLHEKVRVVLLYERGETCDLAAQINESLAFEDLDEAPEDSGGRVVVESASAGVGGSTARQRGGRRRHIGGDCNVGLRQRAILLTNK